MSQQHGTVPGFLLSSASDGSYSDRPTTSAAYTAGATATVAPQAGPVDDVFESLPGSGLILLPLRQSSDAMTNEPERRITWSLGIHLIPSPPHSGTTERRNRWHSVARLELPSTETVVGMPGSQLTGAGAELGNVSPSSPQATRGDVSRRTLTSRSPPLHRTATLGRLQPVPGTVDAQQPPFISRSSRIHSAEPGTSGLPPLPTPPMVQRAGYNFPSTLASGRCQDEVRTQYPVALPASSLGFYLYHSQRHSTVDCNDLFC